ncbi:class I SAM-dependent methyltransferase [Alteromonas sp. H39]|uniref:class I SAM-dependent methyltransferase n=1 Tax=Alteromonas sp. H39 TaxID=3389876 RepID=UPI0039E1D232
MSNYWTDYWLQGHLTSFGDDIKSNYTGTLFSKWQDFFESFKDEALVVVDIGTGNGALIDIAVNEVECQEPTFIGVDYANLKIGANLTQSNVSFLPNTPAEKLPFDDNSVDVVVSQFGIEYSDLTKSIPEVERVLKEHGRVQWVMHDRNSSIVKPNSQIFDAIIALQEDNGPLNILRQLINALAKFGPQSVQAENCRNALNSSIQQVASSNQQGLYGTNFPSFLKAVMNPSVKFKDKKQMLKLFEKEMKGQFERLQDLLEASLNSADKTKLIEALEQAGFDNINGEAINQDGSLAGYLLTASKSAI